MMVREHSSRKERNPTTLKLIEAVIVTAFGGVGGAACGGIAGMAMAPLARRCSPVLASISRAQFARIGARDCSAFAAAGCGIGSIMRGIRGKDDVTNYLVSVSGAGLASSFVTQGLKVKPAYALSQAAYYAVLTGTGYKVIETIRSRNAQDASYAESRAMLLKLGLEKYEKNFKKGHFTDPTLPLLNDRELQEMNIPPGARLLILDHIKRHPKMVNRK